MYLIYGAGNIGKGFLNECKKRKIKEIIITDSNCQLWGKEIQGFKILNPDEIDYSEIKLAIIATGYNFYKEIKKILMMQIEEKKIAFYRDVILLSQYDIINFGNLRLKKSIDCPGIYQEEEIVHYLDVKSFNDFDKFFYQGKHRLIHKFIHYTEGYERFFSKYKGKKITLLEIGISKGGSLQMWKSYFGEKAQIIGVDINPECKKMEGENIKVFIGDQGDKNFLRYLKNQIGIVDIIIDDGGHMMDQQISSFEELFDNLSNDGVYLCEDCHTSYWQLYNGGYKKENTFIEYAKDIIDGLNAQYLEQDIPKKFIYKDTIKSVTFYDSMVFIERKKITTKSISLRIETEKTE